MAGWMIDDKDPARDEIVRRAMALGITGTPDQASHHLGEITLADGKTVQAHVVHAVDAVITDGTEVVIIDRLHEPGKGKPALPGGLMDPVEGGTESPLRAAAREALEEVGVELGEGQAIGTRNMNRPFDVRVASNDDLLKYGIKQGDVFMISTQAIRFDVPDLANTKLTAGDDAAPGSARRVEATTLTRDTMGIPDHYAMIVEALPEQFPSRTDGKPWTDATRDRTGRNRP